MNNLTDIYLLKSRYGRYEDNVKNRALHRVGQEYGSKKEEEYKEPKNKPANEEFKEKRQYTKEELTQKLEKTKADKEKWVAKKGEDYYNKRVAKIERLLKQAGVEEEPNKKESVGNIIPANKTTEQPKEKVKNNEPQNDEVIKEEEEIQARIKFDDIPNSGKVKFKKYLSNRIKTRIDDSFKNLSKLDDDVVQTLHDNLVKTFNDDFEGMKKSERAEALYKIMKIKNELTDRANRVEEAQNKEDISKLEQLEAEAAAVEESTENPNVKPEVVENIEEAIYESQDNPVSGQVENTSETDPGNYDGNVWFEGDPSKLSKDELAERSVKHIQNFLKVNNLPVPEFVMGKYEGAKNKFQETGHYSRKEGRVYLNAAKTRNPVLKPGGMQWSYPGYKVDKTPLGVLAHEVGHHIDHVMNLEGMSMKGNKVTGYEPTYHEAIAESLRLFILNPDLLKKLNKDRYQFFIDKGLKPTVTAKWDEVLKTAPKAYHEQIDKY